MDRPDMLISDDFHASNVSHTESDNASESLNASSPLSEISGPVSHTPPNEISNANQWPNSGQLRNITSAPFLASPPYPQYTTRGGNATPVFLPPANFEEPGGEEELQGLVFTHRCPNCDLIFNLRERLPAKDLICGHIMCHPCFAYEGRCPLCMRVEQERLAASQEEAAVEMSGGSFMEQSFLLPFALGEVFTQLESDVDHSDRE